MASAGPEGAPDVFGRLFSLSFCTVPNQMFQTMFQTMLQNIFQTMFQTMLQNKITFQTMFQTIFQTNITKPITPYPIPLSTVRNQEVEKLLNHPCCCFSMLSSRLARSEAHTSRQITTNIKFVTKPNLSQPWQVRRIPSPLFPQVRKMYFNLHPRSHVTLTA